MWHPYLPISIEKMIKLGRDIQWVQPIRKLAETLSEINFCFKSGCTNQKLMEVSWGRMGTLSAGFFNKIIHGRQYPVSSTSVTYFRPGTCGGEISFKF